MKKWKIVIADNNNSNILTSDGFYTDIVDFPNETNDGQDLGKRDEYVKTFFFLDLENDITLAPLRENPKESENEGSFSISIKNSKFSFDELLMKNYACLVTFDNEGVEKKREFIHIFLTGFTKGEEGMVSYNYIVDLPMTYPEAYRTKEGVDTFIERSHTQSYDFTEGYIYEDANILTEDNFDDLEPGYLDENRQTITFDWYSYVPGLSQEFYDRMNKIVWVYIFKKVPAGENPSNIYLGQFKDIPDFTNLACQVFLAPIQNNMEIIQPDSTTSTQWGGWDVLKDVQSDENVLSIQPIDNFLLDFDKYFEDILYDSTTGKVSFKVKNLASGIISGGLFKVSSIYDFNSTNRVFQKILIPDKPIFTLPSQPAEIKNEVKLFTSTHRTYQIINVNAEAVSFSPEWIKKDENNQIEIFPFYSYSPDKTTLAYMIEETNNDNFITKKGSMSSEVIELQQTAQPVDDFFIKNKISFITGAITGTVGLGGSVIGGSRRMNRNRRIRKQRDRLTLKSMQSDLFDLALGSDSSFGNTFNSLKLPNTQRGSANAITAIAGYKFANNIANVGDLANQPSQSKNTLNSVIYYLQVSNKIPSETIFTTLRNNDSEMEIAFRYYQAMGHNYSNFGDYNKLKLGNYYMNYLQITNLFQNLDNNLSAKLNAIISNNFSEGVRVWHYRNKDTWKGINNFEFENTSMDLINISPENNPDLIVFNFMRSPFSYQNLQTSTDYGYFNGIFGTPIYYDLLQETTIESINSWDTIIIPVTQNLINFLGGKRMRVYIRTTIKNTNSSTLYFTLNYKTNNSTSFQKSEVLEPNQEKEIIWDFYIPNHLLLLNENMYVYVNSSQPNPYGFEVSPNGEMNILTIIRDIE